jgi:hypothetical protein
MMNSFPLLIFIRCVGYLVFIEGKIFEVFSSVYANFISTVSPLFNEKDTEEPQADTDLIKTIALHGYRAQTLAVSVSKGFWMLITCPSIMHDIGVDDKGALLVTVFCPCVVLQEQRRNSAKHKICRMFLWQGTEKNSIAICNWPL